MIRAHLPRVSGTFLGSLAPLPERLCPNVEDCLGSGTLLLERVGIETARLDAECLLAHVLASTRWQVILEPRRRLRQVEFGRYLALLLRRERREPLAYVLGTREFWSLPLGVSSGVLIPRPETETLVEAALAILRRVPPQPPTPNPQSPVILDLCTGTGAVAVALARELLAARIIATDISRRAIRVARANAERHGVADRVTFLRGDLWRALDGHAPADGVDLIVSNPPYIPSGTLATLMPEVQWEPRRALDGGRDGLQFHREIIAGAPQHLRPGGCLLLEIGAIWRVGTASSWHDATPVETEKPTIEHRPLPIEN
ncbi:MAG: peptide chain release factor N(5)-glutamine methyltransferase [candidate division NC10 bacterium]|nr:peptide chain release factor N(5)-glutamine methyltransferase [candidate division NC10 bacterium]